MTISGTAGKMVMKLTNKIISKTINGMYKMYSHKPMTSESNTPERMTKATNVNLSTTPQAKLQKGRELTLNLKGK